MKIYICSLISKKNFRFLSSHLKSINSLIVPSNLKLKIIFIINPKIYIARNLINNLLDKVDYFILESKKDDIPSSRNVFLKFIQNKNIQYAGFLDDDCIIDKNWLFNMIKFINRNNCDIIGGPQKHKVKNKIFQSYFDALEPNRQHGKRVKWVATNNCLFSKKIFKDSKIFFETKLANYGGSDQLFFNELYKKNFVIKWNAKSFITENYNLERENKFWFFRRNLRYGYSGNLIDKKIFSKIGFVIILVKIIYLIITSLFLIIIPMRRCQIKASFYLLRALGRLIGLFNYKPKKYI